MNICLGNLSLEEFEKRASIQLNDEDREFFNKRRSMNATITNPENWHIFDIPFCMDCGSKQFAEIARDRLMKYDWSHCGEPFTIQFPMPIDEDVNT